MSAIEPWEDDAEFRRNQRLVDIIRLRRAGLTWYQISEEVNLGMTWEESVDTSGLLGGFDPLTNKPCSEGFIIRNANSFKTNDGTLPVADNEFNNLFKIVRAKHVKTDVHWTKTWKAANLLDYTKYNWHSYEYMKAK